MKFSVARKINLELIDKDWRFENEDISVQDADSIEEAHKALDKAVAERIGYLRAKSEAAKTAKNPAQSAPAAAPAPAPVPQPYPTGEHFKDLKSTAGGVSDQPPAEFNV